MRQRSVSCPFSRRRGLVAPALTPRTRPRGGHTLAELLLVTVIVTILMALLLALYGPARSRARQSQCAHHLYQLGLASLMYAQDHDGFFPPYRNTSPGRDCDLTETPTSGECAPSLLRAALAPFVHEDAIWYCPSDPVARRGVDRWRINHANSSYAYNARRGMAVREDGVQLRAKTSVLRIEPVDYAWVYDANTEYRSAPPRMRQEGCEHNGGVNTWYLDGHVRWER